MTRVVAIDRGHCGRLVREPGEEFDVDLKDPRYERATWFVPVEKKPAPTVKDPNAPPPGAGPKKGSAVQVDEIA